MKSLRERLAGAVVALAVLSGGPALALPHWGSDEVRAERSLKPQPAVVVEVTVQEASGPVERGTLTLAPNFNYKSLGDEHVIDDYALCETLSWNEARRTLSSVNCHALPAFLINELGNRLVLAKALAAAELKDQDPVWSEMELGLAGENPSPLKTRTVGGRTDYLFGDVVAASVIGDAGAATPDEMARLVRALARHLPMHPQIRADIARRSQLPARIEVRYASLGVPARTVIMTLANPRREAVAYPLPAGLPSELRVQTAKEGGDRGAAVRRVLAVIDAGGRDAPPSLASLTARMNASRDPVETLLLFINITQQYSGAARNDPAVIKAIAPKLRAALKAPQAMPFWQANSMSGDPRTEGDRVAAADYLARSKALDALPFGTFRYVTYANLAQATKGADQWPADIRNAMPAQLTDNYWRHIAAYPWAANVYMDLGSAYPFDPGEAWLAYDLGRAVDPQWRDGVMSQLVGYEQRLKQRLPDFF